ncbi:MAG: type II toxin-antitoxin system YoeB family toxin [Pseudomonadales bacterium]|nr:type II toxin-antitoxin system YoeB family toxin [Pseudomonadales bacterium]
MFEIIDINLYQNAPAYEKLVGDLEAAYSIRINLQHRLVYQVLEHKKAIKILRLWTNYE